MYGGGHATATAELGRPPLQPASVNADRRGLPSGMRNGSGPTHIRPAQAEQTEHAEHALGPQPTEGLWSLGPNQTRRAWAKRADMQQLAAETHQRGSVRNT